MKRLDVINQVLCRLFKTRIINSVEHYSQSDIVSYYEHYYALSEDENEVFQNIKSQGMAQSTLLVIGAGCGREIHHFLNLDFTLFAFEPVTEMLSKIDNRITKFSQLDQVNFLNFDYIWITKNLFSIISEKDFIQLCKFIQKSSHAKTQIFFNADIFEVTFKNSKKFYFSQFFVRLISRSYRKGDVLRRNLDFGTKNSNLVIYHYYQSESKFLDYVNMHLPNLKIRKMNNVFFVGSFQEIIS